MLFRENTIASSITKISVNFIDAYPSNHNYKPFSKQQDVSVILSNNSNNEWMDRTTIQYMKSGYYDVKVIVQQQNCESFEEIIYINNKDAYFQLVNNNKNFALSLIAVVVSTNAVVVSIIVAVSRRQVF